MAKKIRVTRKEIMEPDAFLTFTARASQFVAENRGLIIGTLTGIILLVLAVAGYSYNRTANAEKMEALLFEMEKARSVDDKTAALNEMKTWFEKLDGADYKQRGGLLLASAEYDNGNFDTAAGHYEDVVAAAAPGSLAHNVALQGLAYSELSRNQYDKAIEHFKSLISSSRDFPLFDTYAGLVRCYEGKNDTQNAVLTLREMEIKFQGHPQAAWVQRRIKTLSPGA
jgi:predicted negative regulator of RcsB-dependent stress response